MHTRHRGCDIWNLCGRALFKRFVFQIPDVSSSRPTIVAVDESSATQRIDNFLSRHLKVPRSHIHKLIRKEVRVNKKRVDFSYKLQTGDVIRIPPVRVPTTAQVGSNSPNVRPLPINSPTFPVLYSDPDFMAIDKPGDIAVHGGSFQETGVIECIRNAHPEFAFLSLVHRIDKETSGVLLLAKSRQALQGVTERGEFEKK